MAACVYVCLSGSSNQTTAFTLALHISWKTNTISHLLWGCRKQFETSSTCVVYFTAYLCWIKSVCLYNMHAWNLFRLTSGKYHRWFQFELFSFKHYITVRLQSRTQLPVPVWRDFDSFLQYLKGHHPLSSSFPKRNAVNALSFVSHSWQSTKVSDLLFFSAMLPRSSQTW